MTSAGVGPGMGLLHFYRDYLSQLLTIGGVIRFVCVSLPRVFCLLAVFFYFVCCKFPVMRSLVSVLM